MNKPTYINFCKKCPEEIFKPNCDSNFPCPYYMDDGLIKIEEEDVCPMCHQETFECEC